MKQRPTPAEILDGLNLNDTEEIALAYFFFTTDEWLHCANPKGVPDVTLRFLREIGEESDKGSPNMRKISILTGRFVDLVETLVADNPDGSAFRRLREFEAEVTKRSLVTRAIAESEIEEVI